MIPGIGVDATTEQQIWSAFQDWADHFRRDLADRGVQGLL